MAIYLLEKLNIGLNTKTRLDNLKQTEVKFRITEKKEEKITLSQYPSLVYAISEKYAESIDIYKFSKEDGDKGLLAKVDIIEKQRMKFIEQVLGFEKYIFDNSILDKSKFSNTTNHKGFGNVCKELALKGFDENKLTKIRNVRNYALHGGIPNGSSFSETVELINLLKNENYQRKNG
jgi:hypothetical protein